MRLRINIFGGIAVGFLSLAVFGCATERTVQPAPNIVRTERHVSTAPETYEGSLWLSDNQNSFLFADHKARYVNDLITINIVESTSATNKASSKTEKDNTVSLEISDFLGVAPGSKFTNFWGGGGGFNPSIAASSENEFEGTGSTSVNGTVSATMTARVIQVLENGNLAIEGRKDITVNRETQSIILRGIVRPKDISEDNVVLSSKIADVNIAFMGKGIISERQRPGWMTRALDWVWPF